MGYTSKQIIKIFEEKIGSIDEFKNKDDYYQYLGVFSLGMNYNREIINCPDCNNQCHSHICGVCHRSFNDELS